MIFVYLHKQTSLNNVHPIVIERSFSANDKFTEIEKKLVKEIIQFLYDNFKYEIYNEEIKQDVPTLDLNKYVADMVNDGLHSIDPEDGRTIVKHTYYDCAAFINETEVVSGIVYLPGEEIETVQALFKMYFNGKPIKLVEY